MKCKNKVFIVTGFVFGDPFLIHKNETIRVICTNDEKGKTLSLDNGKIQFSIPMEEIYKCFEGDYTK